MFEINTSLTDELNRLWMRKIDIETGLGDRDRSLANVFTGINHRMANSVAPKYTDGFGLTFFTRPDLRLDERNAEGSRRLDSLLTSGPNTMAAAITTLLDPYNQTYRKYKGSNILGAKLMDGVMCDNRNPFMPILSNRLVSLTGFPDSTVDIYTSNEGIKRQQWSMVDSTNQINNTFSLNATFQNIAGDPLTAIFNTWLEYMANVYEGTFHPRVDNLICTRKDYETRIYRLILDPTKTYVEMIGIANACFPVNDNIGAIMNLEVSTPFVTAADSVSIQFHCQVAQYRDPILIKEFNELVMMYNPDLVPRYPQTPTQEYIPMNHTSYVKLTEREKSAFNYYGYPRIDPITRELQWWVHSDDYYAKLNELEVAR